MKHRNLTFNMFNKESFLAIQSSWSISLEVVPTRGKKIKTDKQKSIYDFKIWGRQITGLTLTFLPTHPYALLYCCLISDVLFFMEKRLELN